MCGFLIPLLTRANKFVRFSNTKLFHNFVSSTGIGHKLLRFFVRFTQKNLSTCDPVSVASLGPTFDYLHWRYTDDIKISTKRYLFSIMCPRQESRATLAGDFPVLLRKTWKILSIPDTSK